MRCARCHGLLVIDHFMEVADPMGLHWARCWRCVNCGDVVDPLIVRRRYGHGTAPFKAFTRRLRRPTRHQDAIPIGV